MLGFHSFLRMGSSEFNEILNEIAGDIMRMHTVIRDSVTHKERLVVTLRYLASGKPHFICKQKAQLMLINRGTRLEVSQSHETWNHSIR